MKRRITEIIDESCSFRRFVRRSPDTQEAQYNETCILIKLIKKTTGLRKIVWDLALEKSDSMQLEEV